MTDLLSACAHAAEVSRETLEEQLCLFSRAIQQSPNALIITRADGTITFVNPSFTRLTGYTAEEVIGRKPLWFTLEENHLPKPYHTLWSKLRQGLAWEGEIFERQKSGEPYWARESITPLSDGQGQISHYLIIRQDITREKKNQQALAESEARFRQIADMSGEWLWEQDAEGRYTYCSSAVTQILGYQPEELIGHSYLEFTRTEDLDLREHELHEPVKNQQPFHHLINRYRHRDGHVVYTESTGSPIFDDRGRLIKWLGVDHDITRRKAYEDALKLRDRAIEAANIGIVIGDAHQPGIPTLYANPAVTRITGYSREELLGRSLVLLQGRETGEAELEQIRRALTQGEDCKLLIKNYRKNGEPFWNDLQISPVRDENGSITHFIGILDDVTERRRAENERRELEIAQQIQSSLLPKSSLHFQGLWVAGRCVSANQVGGDYFDYYPAGDGLDIVIADVSGHSVGAALIMVEARSSLRAETRQNTSPKRSPATILSDVNALLYDDLNAADLFISLFYLHFCPCSREIRYVNAGHPPALLLRNNADICELLDTEGMIFGVKRQVDYEEKILRLKTGDRILLYTDGIIEARDATGEFFGTERLSELFMRYRHEAPQVVIERLLAELRAYCADMPCEDDATLIVMVVE